MPNDNENGNVIGIVAQALELFKSTKRASPSSLQRKLKLSLKQSYKVMDHLEEHKVISGPDDDGDREILVDFDEGMPEVPELVLPPSVVRKNKDSMIKVALTESELLKAGEDLADAMVRIEKLTDEKQEFNAQHKVSMQQAEMVQTKSGNMIRNKYEHRSVPCEALMDYEQETYTLTRSDNGEVVESRKMTADELSELPMNA